MRSAPLSRGEAAALVLAAIIGGAALWEAREAVRLVVAIYAVALGWGA